MSIWRKKPISAFEADMKKSDLQRVLGKWSLTAIGIGAIIGGGIFVLTGKVAHYNAGPALALSFVVAGIACIFAALCYAEFASMLPVEGSAYAYAYGTVGEVFAWLIGWGLILEYGMGAMTVAVSWSGYFNKFLGLFGMKIPPEFANAPFDQNPGYMNVPAFLITWVVTSILVKGIKEAASANNIIVILKVSAILFVIFVGMFFIKTANWIPFIPEPEMIKGEDGNMHQAYGVQGIFAGAASIFFAYIGFDAVSTQAGEAINPKKDMPFAIIASLLICTALYIVVALVLTGMMNYKEFTGEDLKAPVAAAFQKNGIDWAMYIITAAATAGLISVMLVMMLGQTRIFLGMAKDGLLPEFFKAIHNTFKTPYKSTLLVGLVVSLVAAFAPLTVLGDMTSFGTLFAFAMVCGAVWLLRVKEPNVERPFKVPALPLIASLGVIVNLFLIFNLDKRSQLLATGWMALGVIVYFLYSKKNSNLEKNTNA
jgi:APA family basic amino acid/polyamine antiporter